MPIIMDPYRHVGPMVLTFQASAVSTADASSYTFSAQAIGTATPERIVIVVMNLAASVSSDRTITSVTIGGITATQQVLNHGATVARQIGALYSAIVPSGTTADVVITIDNAMQNSGIGVWTLTGGYTSATPALTESDYNAAGVFDLSVNVLTGDVIVAGVGVSENAGDRTYTWVGATEVYDQTVETSTSTHSGASTSSVTTASPRTITATASSTYDDGVAVVAVWR